jgi:hypothetical protein
MQEVLKLVSSIKKSIDSLRTEITKMRKTHAQRITEEWIGKEEVLHLLKISERKLQTMRDNGTLPFSHIDGKIYYKTTDIEQLLNNGYNKR